MIQPELLLVTLVRLADWIPEPPVAPQRKRGRPKVYADRLIIKALIIMIIPRLYSATSLLNFLEQETALTQHLRERLTQAGCFPSRRTWERRLKALPDTLPQQIGCLGRLLVTLLQPWQPCGRAVAVDSTPLRAKGGVWHKKHRQQGISRTARLTPKRAGRSRVITVGGMDGNCIWLVRYRRCGFLWRQN
jgi:hypothetical protein